MGNQLPPRSGKGGRLLGTLRRPNYSEKRLIFEAKRILKKSKKRRRVFERFGQKRSWRWSSRQKIKSLKAAVDVLKAQAKRISPPKRKKPPIPAKERPLLYRLVKEQHIGKQWIPILNKMVSAGMVSLHENTNLREDIAIAIRPYNKGAAAAFAQGRALYLQRGNQSLENILRTARQTPLPGLVATREEQIKRAKTKSNYM